MKNILVTGATGFIGKPLCTILTENGMRVRPALRSSIRGDTRTSDCDGVTVGEMGPETDWCSALAGMDIVVHLAARVHEIHDSSLDPLAEFRRVNVTGTLNLAQQAAKAGLRRFIYLSSIKVNGEHTGLRWEESGYRNKNEKIRFSETDTPNPQDPYAVSKWEAEQLLHDIATETGMEVVIVRPPLVYGPGVKANFLRLLQFAEKGLPLPLASIRNKRSMVSLDNLVDFLICCLEHPAAAGEIFLISDGEDVSTPELIQRIASQIKRPARLFPVPVNLLKLVAKLTGKTAELDRLCGSLQVDISKAKKVLGWKPPFSVDQGLAKTVAWYTKR